jgi:ABC-2 type transport system ATP-binding protein
VNEAHRTTIILTTHDLADIEHLCERMVIIDHGRVVHDGPLEDFRSRHGTHRTVVVDLEYEGDPLDIEDVEVARIEGARQWLRFDRSETSAAEVVAKVVALRPIRDITVQEPAIEDLVRALYEGS